MYPGATECKLRTTNKSLRGLWAEWRHYVLVRRSDASMKFIFLIWIWISGEFCERGCFGWNRTAWASWKWRWLFLFIFEPKSISPWWLRNEERRANSKNRKRQPFDHRMNSNTYVISAIWRRNVTRKSVEDLVSNEVQNERKVRKIAKCCHDRRHLDGNRKKMVIEKYEYHSVSFVVVVSVFIVVWHSASCAHPIAPHA